VAEQRRMAGSLKMAATTAGLGAECVLLSIFGYYNTEREMKRGRRPSRPSDRYQHHDRILL